MAGVFVSYRRDDSQGFAGRLSDDLADILGEDRVFRDVEIPVGSDFTDVLHRAIAASDALLVVIGRSWAERGPGGHGERLFAPTDWVRTEIEAAFAQGKQVIPVLIGGARMPSVDDLPPTLGQLAVLQAAVLTDRHWDAEVEALADRLQALCPALADDRPARDPDDSPAEVLHELGERLLDEVSRRRRPAYPSPGASAGGRPGIFARILAAAGRGLRKFLGSALLVAAIYIGLRLFGDESTLAMLDAFEARLQIGWDRLQHYLQRFVSVVGHADTLRA